MADNITVDNGNLNDYDVRSSEVTGGKLVQHIRLDIGSGTSESQITASNGLPISSKINLTAASPSQATVGTSSSSIVAANSSRKGLIIVNTSVNRVSLAFGTAAVLNSGITLSELGTFVMDEFCFTTAEVRAIASASSSVVAIQEFS